MGRADDVVAALEAVRAIIGEGRDRIRAAAETYGDMFTTLSTALGASSDPRAAASLGRVGDASDSLAGADGGAVAALSEIGEYIEIVNGHGGGGSAPAASGDAPAAAAFDPVPHLRDMPPFPGTDRKTHGRAVSKGGKVEQVVSGELDPDTRGLDPRYVEGVTLARRLGLVPAKGKLTAAGDVELKWALQMRNDGVKRSQVAISNTDGPCEGSRSCDALLPVWLAEGSELTVHWRDAQGNDQSKRYQGVRDEHA